MMLCCAALLGAAVAADFADADQIVHADAVKTLVELKVVEGKEDGTSFDPAGTVTRAELCKMISVLLNGGRTPELNPTQFSFSDTQDSWAAGYLAYCAKLGVAAGRGDGTFDPDGAVTGVQAAKMLLGAIGFDAGNEGFTGKNWAIAVNVRANQKGLYDHLEDLNPSAPISRDDAAQMIYDALNTIMVTYEYKITTVNGELQAMPVLTDEEDGRTLMSMKFKTAQ
jgi:hypothetical protein